MDIFQEQWQQQLQMQQAGRLWNNEWNLAFTSEFIIHLYHSTVYEHFKAIVKELGMPEQRVHVLWHCYAMTMSMGMCLQK